MPDRMTEPQVPTTEAGGIDWRLVRERLDRSRAALESAFSGKGPWTDDLLLRRERELAGTAASALGESPRTAVLIAHGQGSRYGLELTRLGNILPLPRVARVPGAPPELLGLVAVGGRAMRIFDVDRLCGQGVRTAETREGGFAVVLRGMARPIALRLQAVEAVAEIDLSRFGTRSEAGPYVRAITEERVAILDVAAIIDALQDARKGTGDV